MYTIEPRHFKNAVAAAAIRTKVYIGAASGVITFDTRSVSGLCFDSYCCRLPALLVFDVRGMYETEIAPHIHTHAAALSLVSELAVVVYTVNHRLRERSSTWADPSSFRWLHTKSTEHASTCIVNCYHHKQTDHHWCILLQYQLSRSKITSASA